MDSKPFSFKKPATASFEKESGQRSGLHGTWSRSRSRSATTRSLIEGDYAAYRKAYKAWSARSSLERKSADLRAQFREQHPCAASLEPQASSSSHDAPPHKKPRGKAPKVNG